MAPKKRRVGSTSFLVLTAFAVLGIFVLTFAGAFTTSRARTPSISVIIDDEPTLRLLYGLFVGALTVSRTWLVFERSSMDDPKRIFAFACGSTQLICFNLVGMFSVILDKWYHYAAALGTVVFGFVCEALFINALCWGATYVSLLTFGVFTALDNYSELRVNVALAEWIGYYLVAAINVFRIYDRDEHEEGGHEEEVIPLTSGPGRVKRRR